MLENRPHHVRPVRGQEPEGGGMLPVLASQDDVDGALGVELVQFIPSLDHRHVPSEEIDEEALAVC